MENNWKTWPNLITVLGILGIGVYVWAYLNNVGPLVFPLIVFVGLTDFFDGVLARRTGQVSRLGAILDPIRDKLALAAILGNIAYLYKVGQVLIPVALLVLFEIGASTVVLSRKDPQLPNTAGKVRGFSHFTAAAIIVFSSYHLRFLGIKGVTIIVSAMAAFSIAAFVGYILFPKKASA